MKCSKCKREYVEEQMTKVGKKHYCNDCYDNYYLPEVEDWSTLFENIKGRNNLKTLPISTITLLKRYHNEDKLSYIGMSLTYDYIKDYADIKEVEGKDNGNYSVGLIPYFYTQAKTFFEDYFRLEDLAEEAEEDNEVTIKSKQYNKEIKKKDIDISSINFEEDEDD